MLIKCITNKSELINNWSKNSSVPLEDILIIGKLYSVYGILIIKEIVCYEILTNYFDFPFSWPSFLFEVVDNRLSSIFCFGSTITGDNETVPCISFKERVENNDFLAKLIDGDKHEVEILNHYTVLLELEHRNPDIKQQATEIQSNWVQCPVCTKAWELEHPDFEMCKCPDCKTVLLNPFKVKSRFG